MQQQQGISPKVVATIATALSAFAAQAIAEGTIDRTALATLVVTLIAAGAAWFAPPGELVSSYTQPSPGQPDTSAATTSLGVPVA